MYSNRKPPEEAPCDTCKVDPIRENIDAIRVFLIVRNQFIMSMSGPIDLNHLAIDSAIDREGIKSKNCFRKVTELGKWWVERLREKK